MLRRSADRIAGHEQVPTSLRAVLGYYAASGVFDFRSLLLKRRVDETVGRMVEEMFDAVADEIAAEFDRESVTFEYDTKLLLPAELTLGYLYRHADDSERERAERLTRLVIKALLDGDMRDARNDDEFEDFEVDFPTDTEDARRIAEIAQELLESGVEASLASQPDHVRERYEWAVSLSEEHQQQDKRFRKWLSAARDGDEGAIEQIEQEYKHAVFEDRPVIFDDEEEAIPYLKTQYDRVGVIYDAMLQVYEEAGFPVGEAFRRSIVFAIIGAQLWLDDVDDYEDDMREEQLTPVTAEYLLAEDDATAYSRTVEISQQYLTRAKREATTAESTLTGIAIEYIVRDGDPRILPGAEAAARQF